MGSFLHSRTLTTAILTMGKSVAISTNIAMVALLARILPSAEYGAFAQVVTIYAILSLVMQIGVPQAVYYYMPRLPEAQRHGLALQSAAVLALFGAAAGGVLFVGAAFLGQMWNSPELPSLLRAFAPYPAFALPVVAMESVLIAVDRPITVALFAPIAKLMSLVFLVSPIALGTSMQTGIRFWVAASALQAILALYLLKRPFKGTQAVLSRRNLLNQLSFSSSYALASMFGTFAYYADKILIGANYSPTEYATYVNGAIEIPIVAVIGGAVTMAITSDMVRLAMKRDTLGFLSLWHRVQGKTALLVLPMAFFFFFFSRDTITLLFGSRYSESAGLFSIFLMLIPTRLASFQSIMGPLRLNREYALGHLVQLVSAFLLITLLIPALGLPGAAIGVVGAAYINVIFLAHSASRPLGIPFFRMWPLGLLARIAAVAFASSFIGWIAATPLPTNHEASLLLRLVVGLGVTSVIYIVLGRAFGLLRVDRHLLFGLRQSFRGKG